MSLRRPLAVLAAVAALAAWLDFSRLQQSHQGDSLVPVLTGLTAWTPFFWGQDRFGMLIPLLALPVRDPAAHLLLQGFLVIALCLWGLLLLARTLLPESSPWVPAAALSLVLVLLLPPEEQRFNILWVQPYTLSLSLGLSALELLRRPGAFRILGAAALLFLAAWVNVGVWLMVLPLVLWRVLVIDTGRPGVARWRFALLSFWFLALAVYASTSLSKAVAMPHTVLQMLPARAWQTAATELVLSAWSADRMRLWLSISFGLAALGLLSLALERVRAEARPALLAAAGLAVSATIPFAAAATSKWVAVNEYSLRYLLPSLLLLEAACCLLATLPLLALPVDVQGTARRLSAAAVALATLVAVGPPSRGAVVEAFESKWGAAARDVIAAHATHVTGDYWKVWPIVFYADWLLGPARRKEWPYGLSDRSLPTLRKARAVSHPRVAALDGRGMWLGLLGPRAWTVVERRPTFLLLTLR